MFHNKMHFRFGKLFIAIGLLFTGILPAIAQESTNSDDWQFGSEIYLWGAEIKADTNAGPKIDITFKEIIEDLDAALMGTISAKKNKLKLFADIIYLDIDDSTKGYFNLPIGDHPPTIGNKLSAELKAWVVQPMVAYTVYETPKSYVNLSAGARYLWIEVDTELRTAGPLGGKKLKASGSGHKWDGVIGIKGKTRLTDKWDAALYLDAGSGDSDYTWQGLAAFTYRFEKFNGIFGYRHLKWDFDDKGALKDLQISGPFAGAQFTF